MRRLLTGIGLSLAFMVHQTSSAQPNVQGPSTVPPVAVTGADSTPRSQWAGKRVAFLGDSMTDPGNTSTTIYYWAYLQQLMRIEPRVYAKSGHQWHDIYRKAEAMHKAEGDSVDAVIIWAGTNDYNHSIPMGRFYTERDSVANVNGQMLPRKHRTWAMDDTTFCGRINRVLSYLKHHYPHRQVIIMTPIHRAYADFSKPVADKQTGTRRMRWNIQPDEDFANGQGLYIEDYVRALRQAGDYWSVPVIDLFARSGLYPLEEAHADFFHDAGSDLLHPNAVGHWRIARTIQMQLLTLPVGGL